MMTKSDMAKLIIDEARKMDPNIKVQVIGAEPGDVATLLEKLAVEHPDWWVMTEKLPKTTVWLPLVISDDLEDLKTQIDVIRPQWPNLIWIFFAGDWMTNNLSRLKNPLVEDITHFRIAQLGRLINGELHN